MERNFNAKEYVKLLGEELIYEFEKAGKTTHPHAVGSGRENSAREKLKAILPAGVGVGSGFVIDSFGNTSKQCDLILYEEAFAMKFVINGDTINTYYNCESVIAVGEIKSNATMTEIRNSIDKLVCVKQLKRQNDDGYDRRKYLMSGAIRDHIGNEKIPYNSDDEPLKQIFTFILCQSLKAETKSIIEYMKEKCSKECEYVNKIVSTDGAYISFYDINNVQPKILPSRINANHVGNLVDNKFTFNHFVSNLVDFIITANTVPLNYRQYLSMPLTLNDIKELIKL